MSYSRLVTLLVLLPALAGATLAADRGGDRDRVAKPSAVQRTAPPGTRFDQVVATGSDVNMTITNYGFYGNNYFNRDASLEYPAGLGYEHLVRSGLWIGAHASDDNGEFIGVTTGTVDAAQGPTSPEASEFSPGGREILRRSTLLNSDFFSRDAISEQDVISDFNDLTLTTAASNYEPHRPLRISVHQENYQWGFGNFLHCLFFHISVKNEGAELDSLWIGMYTEFASGNKNGYVQWPPAAADPGGLGFWYRRKWVVSDDSLKLLREHYCANGPPPDYCQLQIAPYWIGERSLGARGVDHDTTTRKLTLAGWNYSPGLADRDQDVERYAIMKSQTWETFLADSLQPHGIATGAPDPVELYCIGPFPVIPHGGTVSADFAIVGGASVLDIQRHSKFAQFAFDNNYVVPVPPVSPRMHLVPRDTAVDVYWDKSSELSYDPTSPIRLDFEGYRVNIGENPKVLARVAQFDLPDTSGFNTGFSRCALPDSVTFGEQRCDSAGNCVPIYYHYKYTIGALRNGFKYFVTVTAYDLGNAQQDPLESGTNQNMLTAIPGPAPGEPRAAKPIVFPNPYRVEALWDIGQHTREHYLWFAGLPQRCKIKILTLSGDLVFEKDFDGSTYRGEGALGIYRPPTKLDKLQLKPPVLSGATFGWDMITTEGQAIATGLYLYTVEDKATGDRTIGKFLVVKSDRDR